MALGATRAVGAVRAVGALPGSAGLCRALPGSAGPCRALPGSAGPCRALPGSAGLPGGRAALRGARCCRCSRRVPPAGAWSQWPVDHFLRAGRIAARDGAAVRWFHAANSRARAAEAARSDVHMVEVDVVLRGGHGEPVLAHPPSADSDISLREWLALMGSSDKGVKLDFKSLAAVGPSLELLRRLEQPLAGPVWLNGDVLPGPGGSCAPLDARAFLGAVTSGCPEATLSLGWTTGCCPGQGYQWPQVREMSRLCQPLSQPVAFAVRAALLPASLPQLRWLLQQSHRYSLSVWTGKEDTYSVQDLLLVRENFDTSRVYYDIFEPQNSEFKAAIGIEW